MDKKVAFDTTVIQIEQEKEQEINKHLDKAKTDINLADYEIPEESSDTSFFVALNVFHLYYKMRFACPTNENMFHGIDPKDITSTNKSLELFYDALHIYNKCKEKGDEYIRIYEPEAINDEKFDDIYALVISGAITNLSPSIFSLILYLTHLKWYSMEWKIIKIKGEE